MITFLYLMSHSCLKSEEEAIGLSGKNTNKQCMIMCPLTLDSSSIRQIYLVTAILC